MRIVHIGLASYFTEGMTYQDNQLSEVNALDGHTVTYISNAAQYENGKIVETGFVDEMLPNGVHLLRLPYLGSGFPFLSGKLRAVRGLYALLVQLKPDVILGHNAEAGLFGLDVARYMRHHPETKLYLDTHTDGKNSARNWMSLYILHRWLYRYIAQKLLPYVCKYLYVTKERKTFAMENYGIPERLMEFYPLGGLMISPETKATFRLRIREELGLCNEDILLLHSGKCDLLKRTEDILMALQQVPSNRLKLIIIGSITAEMKPVLEPLLRSDHRVTYLGWKSGEELLGYLAACDMYLQPGSQSATLENALCCGTPIMVYPHPSYDDCYLNGNGFYVDSNEDIQFVLTKLANGEVDLQKMSQRSFALGEQYFDYKKLAAKLYET